MTHVEAIQKQRSTDWRNELDASNPAIDFVKAAEMLEPKLEVMVQTATDNQSTLNDTQAVFRKDVQNLNSTLAGTKMGAAYNDSSYLIEKTAKAMIEINQVTHTTKQMDDEFFSDKGNSQSAESFSKNDFLDSLKETHAKLNDVFHAIGEASAKGQAR